jgi:hypothetical protein
MGRDAACVILDSVRAVEAWADTRPADLDRLPRAVGACDSSLRGTPLKKVALPYSLWMLQRTLDAYHSLDGSERSRVNAAIADTGWETVLAYQPRHRMAKRGFELVFA